MGAVCCTEEPLDLNGEVDLSYFELLRSVGKGSFGKVRVVQHRITKELFALKYINKEQCINMKAVENIISERQILEKIACDGVVNLRYAFQDDEYLFMVIDLMLGGDLRYHLDNPNKLSEDCVRFYAAEVSLALHYLHQRSIVHRDLKPDNILLNKEGHAHLTDFNVALERRQDERISSMAGSMAYMAPEILLQQGYNAAIDWWSLGIVCYELLFQKRPFIAQTNDELRAKILYDPLRFPENHSASPEAVDFISRLLCRDVNQRLGYHDKGFERLREHPWFRDMDWQKLEKREVNPPFVPNSKGANFDPSHELEEILLEDNPLKARKRKQNRDTFFFGASSMDDKKLELLCLMEEEFLVFDYKKPDENRRRQEEKSQRRRARQNDKANEALRGSNADFQMVVRSDSAVQERDDYIKQAGGVPPPISPPRRNPTFQQDDAEHGDSQRIP